MLANRKLISVKIETTEGTDAVPVVATNALLAGDFAIKPAEGEKKTRNVVRSFLGNKEELIATTHCTCSFDVEVTSGSALGTPSQAGPLLKACGLAETINGVIDVSYLPVSAAFSSLTLYWNEDGILHKFLGARASVEIVFEVDEIPKFKFTLTGLKGTVTDNAIPAGAVYTSIKPLIVSTTNTSFSLFGIASPTLLMKSISFNLANDVKFSSWIGNSKVQLSDRAPKGKFEVRAEPLSVFNPIVLAGDANTGAVAGTITLQHGQTSGKIVQVQTATLGVTISNVDYGEFNGDRTWACDFNINPVAGNDELKIIMK